MVKLSTAAPLAARYRGLSPGSAWPKMILRRGGRGGTGAVDQFLKYELPADLRSRFSERRSTVVRSLSRFGRSVRGEKSRETFSKLADFDSCKAKGVASEWRHARSRAALP
ncbi:hypothetical protein S58_31530 [Bradyrhizobium oligotrophicum S58]|uniref:Uncharacterized protein n=1 Tax=Bradyrhizobium oligotrophicum S58 TaxID=1245469 RepID=M4Z7S6_9BRAD|nr:hypothetical protein S58_31530 [Bradyrhizobium oligotrophicum S58]